MSAESTNTLTLTHRPQSWVRSPAHLVSRAHGISILITAGAEIHSGAAGDGNAVQSVAGQDHCE